MRAAAVATLSGAFVASRIEAPVPGLAAGAATVAAVFALLAQALGAQALGAQGFDPVRHSVRHLTRTVTRRLPHGRNR